MAPNQGQEFLIGLLDRFRKSQFNSGAITKVLYHSCTCLSASGSENSACFKVYESRTEILRSVRHSGAEANKIK